jgi:hypothetical protein
MKGRFADNDIARSIDGLARRSDHRVLAVWAADCATRVLPLFEAAHPEDPRPRKAIGAARKWARDGIFRMADVRRTALDSHAAARKAPKDSAAGFAARAAGHAIATAHVPTHSIAAAWYAAKAAWAKDPEKGPKNVQKERLWQYRRLGELANSPAARLSKAEMNRIKAAVRREFPGDPALQRVHIARRILSREAELEGMTFLDYVRKVNSEKGQAR